MAARRLPLAALLFLITGCALDEPMVNPSFSISSDDARQLLRNEAAHPRPLPRPLVIVGGFRDPGIAPPVLKNQVHAWTGDDRIVPVSLSFCFSFDDCRKRITDAVQAAYPSDVPDETIEVDVIGVSMGGLAARHAAIREPPDASPSNHPIRRLQIARLFTIGSPLRGAALAAEVPFTLHPLQVAMRPGSTLLRSIESAPLRASDLYQIYSYVRLNDPYMLETETAITGQTPWWLVAPAMSPPHEMAFQDPRILADILRRLHGDEPLATDPPAPLPPRE